MSEAEETIKKHIGTLPLKIQRVLASVDMENPLKKISEEHGLLLDKASSLEAETVLVAVGLESGEDFVDNIAKNVEVNKVEASAIAKEIDELIFSQIRKGLQEDAPADDTGGDEDNIRQQIEKPAPTGSRIQRPAVSAGTSPTDMGAPPNLPTQQAGSAEEDGGDSAGQSIIESKLKGAVVNPFQRTEVEGKVKRSYPDGSDPYKELIE